MRRGKACAMIVLAVLSLSASLSVARTDLPVLSCADWTSWDTCHQNDDGSFQMGTKSDGSIGMLQCNQYFYHGVFSAKFKLQQGNSAGTCLAYYLISSGTQHNTETNHYEIDIEIYGAQDSSDVLFATNVFFSGKQYLVQFHLPFDASADFHNFTILWSRNKIAWIVDGTVYRVLNRQDGNPWPQEPLWPVITFWQPWYADPKPDFSNGPITMSVGAPIVYSGCGYNTSSPSDIGDCPGWTGTDLPWNQDLQVGDSAGPNMFASSNDTEDNYVNDSNLINDFGWDNA